MNFNRRSINRRLITDLSLSRLRAAKALAHIRSHTPTYSASFLQDRVIAFLVVTSFVTSLDTRVTNYQLSASVFVPPVQKSIFFLFSVWLHNLNFVVFFTSVRPFFISSCINLLIQEKEVDTNFLWLRDFRVGNAMRTRTWYSRVSTNERGNRSSKRG